MEHLAFKKLFMSMQKHNESVPLSNAMLHGVFFPWTTSLNESLLFSVRSQSGVSDSVLSKFE